MLFAGWEVRMVKNCDRGLENAARGRIFKSVTVVSVTSTVTVVRDRKIRTELRTNQIVGFVPAWKKINICYLPAGRSVLGKTVPEVLSTQYQGHSISQYGPT